MIAVHRVFRGTRRAALVGMTTSHASLAERSGIFVAIVEAILFAFVAALHLGVVMRFGGATYALPLLYPVGIIEGLLALALLVSVLLPGAGSVRAGRVLAAQVLVLVGVIAVQIALMYGPGLAPARTEIFYGIAFILAVTSIALLAAPLAIGLRERGHRKHGDAHRGSS